ncbi:MAG: potassium transporter [Gemmatimonadales bacterium]|jgi:trk system potassium uptake protein TrkH|nr:MAG: potassium transporter [Gemmatimonadales bacterium]
MSIRLVLNVVGILEVFFGLSMLVPLCVSLVYRDGDSLAFLLSMILTVGIGVGTFYATRQDEEITPREGFAIVTFAWAFAAVFGSLPYLFTGTLDGVWAAVFEAMSGLTTTGATVFSDIESLPHGILFWRSFTHWLGGMGIIVLAIAVLPYLGVGGMQLFRAEVPGPTPERLRPRITQTAKLLWLVYLGMTVLQTVLYMAGGMDWFDASTHTFGTLATGGFSTRNDSMAAFPSPYIQYVTIVFMYLAGLNFSLHFRAVTGRLDYFKDVEWRFFTGVVLGAGLLITAINLLSGDYALTSGGVETALRDGLFQSTSITTTTGYVSADFEAWVPAAQMVIFALMFVGGMAGSTGGGVKAVRVLLLLKQSAMEVRKHLHPRAIFLARVGKHVVKEDVLANVIGFVLLYLLLALAGALAMAAMGMDLLTAIGASAATVGNIGPGLGEVGATDNYGWMDPPALAILSFLMLVGRLEIYTVLLLLLPETWRRRRPRSVTP